MAHPYFHSISSVNQFGGNTSDYLFLHNWFDRSKSVCCDLRHRALRHHEQGVVTACHVFGSEFLNSDRLLVETEAVARQHITEDLGFVPSVSDWIKCRKNNIPKARRKISTSKQNVFHMDKWGGKLEDYDQINRYIDFEKDEIMSLCFRHNSFTVFEVEEIFGTVISNASGRRIPVRLIAESHIKAEYGHIPNALDFLGCIQLSDWMLKVAKPSQAIMSE